ncbi:hypothetical protein, partial [Erwinia tasmaniensis]|uniref:hypothetical protein n=1 Tax=Erwinia tasmaniensis TaxID=338565 RepID=UPI003A4E0018
HSATPPHFILYSFGLRKRPEQLMGRSIEIVTELAKLFFSYFVEIMRFYTINFRMRGNGIWGLA